MNVLRLYNNIGVLTEDQGRLPTFILKEVFAMQVNPKTVKFALELVAAMAVAAAGVVAKYYIDVPQS